MSYAYRDDYNWFIEDLKTGKKEQVDYYTFDDMLYDELYDIAYNYGLYEEYIKQSTRIKTFEFDIKLGDDLNSSDFEKELKFYLFEASKAVLEYKYNTDFEDLKEEFITTVLTDLLDYFENSDYSIILDKPFNGKQDIDIREIFGGKGLTLKDYKYYATESEDEEW